MSDGKFDDELTLNGSDVGDKLRNKNERRKKKNHFSIIFSLNISHSKSYLFRIGGTEFSELEFFIVIFIPVSMK